MFKYILLINILCFWYVSIVNAGMNIDVIYPYSLDKKSADVVYGNSTVPLYININNFDNKNKENVHITVDLPDDFTAVANEKFKIDSNGDAKSIWVLDKNFGYSFDLLYLKPMENAVSGEKKIKIFFHTAEGVIEKNINFTYDASRSVTEVRDKKTIKKERFNWYIQEIVLPVDNYGIKDDKSAENTIYIKDITLENLRNKITGEGTTNWSAVFNHPAGFILLKMRNPQKDINILRFKAELIDKNTGEIVEGLCTVGKSAEDSEHGWAGNSDDVKATTALISLDGKTDQSFILPFYVDYFKIIEGEYNLRVTVEGSGQRKVQEIPLRIEQKHSVGLLCALIAFTGLIYVICAIKKVKKCINDIGAKGAISVALFAAVAFIGISLPTTILGDILHVFMGPFSGLVTGVLNGVFQYILIVALLILFRRSGVLALFFLVKFMLSGLLFGRFTPVGLLSCCVYILVLESFLNLSGFYNKKNLDTKYMLYIAVLIGAADAVITFINLEQIMYFYRLFYADWYLALYVLVNGFIYSSLGAWAGYKLGVKLQYIAGE